MVTSRDVQDIVSKLSSDKAKAREDGVKLLNTWLEGERSIRFCNYLSEKTMKLNPDKMPHAETWPYLITLLLQCVSLEISSSKKRLPKLTFAKTLRIVVQRSEDVKFAGKMPTLLPVVKNLFNHLWDVLSSVPSFQAEYGIILRLLLSIGDYRFHLRKKIYSSLVHFYIERVETTLSEENDSHSVPREEVFRCITTLHSLLENPPGDLAEDVRGDIAKGFIQIFSHVREESKISRKLMECVNVYLLNNGPNLSWESLEIHNAVRNFVFRCWLTTRDHGLKDTLILYARVQLSLSRGDLEGSSLVEELLDVICKELDQGSLPIVGVSWPEATKDDRCGVLSGSQYCLVELSALVLYRACVSTVRAPQAEKRVKREHICVIVKESLAGGKWLWHATFCHLIQKYYSRMSEDLFIQWFEGISLNFERIIGDANMGHAYDGLLWTLRSLQELCIVLLHTRPQPKISSGSSFISEKVDEGWQLIWNSVMQGLPVFSNQTSVVDAALVLLGNIISSETTSTCLVPQDIWDLKLFKRIPSMSFLFFVSCYFSHKSWQGNLMDTMHLRRNLLRAVLGCLNLKDSSALNELTIILIPSASYALCAGYAPFMPCHRVLFQLYSSNNVAESANIWDKLYEPELKRQHEIFECYSEVLANITECKTKVHPYVQHHGVRLPYKLKDSLLDEMEAHILKALIDNEATRFPLFDVFFICAAVCTFMQGSFAARGEGSSFISECGHFVAKLLNHAASVLEEGFADFRSLGYAEVGMENTIKRAYLDSLTSFVCSPIFTKVECRNCLDSTLYNIMVQSVENVLRSLSKLYEQHSQLWLPDTSASDIELQRPKPPSGDSRIVDMELDISGDMKDVDILSKSGNVGAATSFSVVTWKLHMISLMSSFFKILEHLTRHILCELLGRECEPKVREKIIYHLCEHPDLSSLANVTDLVKILNELLDKRINLKLDCSFILVAAHKMLSKISILDDVGKGDDPTLTRESESCLVHLGDLVNKVADFGLLDWRGRVKLVDCICDFVVLEPLIGQTMIERLLLLVRNPDYRVRYSVAQRIGVLFQTWDGHDELFEDICSNFGVIIVLPLKGKFVTAKQVVSAGPQPLPAMETVIITLMHLALHSEKVESKAVFILCAISAIEPCHRELVIVVLNNLSKQLQYSSRFKYLEEIMGSILFSWIACGVTLVSLLEIRQFFVSDVEPSYFMQYSCSWLLPALLLQKDMSSLNWLAKVSGQHLAALVKCHFVPIFSVSMALHCSKMTGWERGTYVLESSILQLAEISENERDKLIKKHMVSIVGHMLSLVSCASEPAVPFFLKDIISQAIRTVVDGFLEIDNHPASGAVLDKINIFRPDRVFMFILEIHYKIEASVHPRHRCHRLAAFEVLIDVLGHRVAISGTANYLFNLTGQFIDTKALQDQSCRIISSLLSTFEENPSDVIFNVQGDQLQFLVAKLVGCCMRFVTIEGSSGVKSSSVFALLRQLVVKSDLSVHDYVRELEPFPEIDIFEEMREFHKDICHTYCPRNHLLKFASRSCYLPPRLLLSSIQALHKKVLLGENYQVNRNGNDVMEDNWNHDQEIRYAIWTLVGICSSDDSGSIRPLVSDFVSRLGVGEPHSVVFHPAREFNQRKVQQNISNTGSEISSGISEDLLLALLRLLKKYLMDDTVRIVDMASQALRGILSTERGQRAVLLFDSYERSLIEIHSKGVDTDVVEKFLTDFDKKYKAEAVPLDDSTLWSTSNKSFEMWICPLVFSMLGFCDDVILRLCQGIVLFKAETAELLFPFVIVDISKRKHIGIDLQKLITQQVEQHIFKQSNVLVKSIQVVLNALNELRMCHVLGRSSIEQSKREGSKISRPFSHGSKSRSASGMARDSFGSSSASTKPTLLWDKVYWLTIDYLLVAKAAVISGSYFTSILYVEHWCKEHFGDLTLGAAEFSHVEVLSEHIEILVSALTQINEPDSLYGIIQSHKLTSQVITFEHEGNWSKALEYYDLQVRSNAMLQPDVDSSMALVKNCQLAGHVSPSVHDEMSLRKPYKGLIRSLQQMGCTHVLDLYCQGLTSRKDQLQHDLEFNELQYEAAWRAGNWDFSFLSHGPNSAARQLVKSDQFHQNLHSCLRALQEGDFDEFCKVLEVSKQELLCLVCCASEESTQYIFSTIIKLQILYHLGMAWDVRWKPYPSDSVESYLVKPKKCVEPIIPTLEQLSRLSKDWSSTLEQTQLHMNLIEPFIAFRRILLQILGCKESSMQHLLHSASNLRKGSRFSQAAAALHDLKCFWDRTGEPSSSIYWLGRLEEAKLLRAQGRHEMAISLAKYVSANYHSDEEASDVYRLVGKWLAETRSSSSRTILEKYLKPAVSLAEDHKCTNKKSTERQSQAHFHLAHYADALFRSYDERLTSSEWQAAMRLRKHKTLELEALVKRFKSSAKGVKVDYQLKIQELQKQLAMDKEEAEKLQDDRDNFLSLSLEGYKRCLVIGDKYDVRVVFRLISLWFSMSSRENVVSNMQQVIHEVQSYKFIPLVYQIASRMGSSKDNMGPRGFQSALVSLVKKMAIDHPYHTVYQLLALANGDRIKDKQRNRSSFVVDVDKILAAKHLLEELLSYHGQVIRQMKQMVDIYIKLAELETRREDTNKRIPLPRDIRGVRQLELVPVVTANIPVERNCQYLEGSFPYFKGLADSVMVMNGINAPKVVECLGSDGKRYRQLAKSGNDDLRQDAVMEQFFSLVNTFLQNNRDTWKRRLGVRTYKVVPFTPSAGVLEWVNGTLPVGEYLIGSTRNGGAHGRYGFEDWSFLKCREHMANEKDKRNAFQEVCENFRPVMHHFFLERFLQPADWFEKRLAYTRSVAASSMVGYIVGLGDRHSMNILIDQATAEVVHIDLGVAFEQGLMLKTPERVPFRLTRDVIDGMGVTGVEGVFIHDPLYKWALSPLKALQRQKETDDDLETSMENSDDGSEGNKDAARALLRVKQKLDGYEEGELRSVNGQVQQLIQDAIDSDRLCQMFPGWGAWL
ncbi:Serine/threonine-protein kinase ATM [Linum perenne]